MHLRLALRRLAATPAFTVGAIAVLALGTGATLAVFTVVNALVLKTLPVREPDRLVAIEVQNARGEPAALPRPAFDTLSHRQRTLTQVSGVLGGSVVSADAGGRVHQAVVDGVTADYFHLLDVPVVEGRPLGVADYRANGLNADPVAVISAGYASRMFGAPVAALGRAIVLGETTVTVVGVTADSFPGIQIGVRTDIVVPAPMVEAIIGLPPNAVPLRYAFGRRAEDQSIEQVRAEWMAIWQSALAATAATDMSPAAPERRLVVTSGVTGVSNYRPRYQAPLQLTLMASGWLMVIACINLAGLQFARGLRRAREIAVSQALGATGWDLIAPTVMESLVISVAGLLLGAPLAAWGARLAVDLLSTGTVPLALDLAPDWSTWAALAALTAMITMATGVGPAWLAARRVGAPIASPRIVASHGRIGSALVAGQIALAFVLLSGAGLAVDALLRVAWGDPGFDQVEVTAAQLTNRPGGYADMNDAVYYRTLVDRMAALPGVSAVALAKPVPGAMSTPPMRLSVTVPGRPSGIAAGVVFASPGYTTALGLSMVAGRDFTWHDDAAATRVALISAALARDLMPEGFFGGLRVDLGTPPLPQHQGLEVVGIVEDASVLNVQDPAPHVIYASALQQPPPMARWPGLLVRTQPGSAPIEPAMTRVLDDLGREFVMRSDTLSGHMRRALARERLLAGVALVYGVLAIAMVAIGLWALLDQDVVRRLREFGVRLSVGASPAVLARQVTARAARLMATGIGLGLVLTWMLGRVLNSTLTVDSSGPLWAMAGGVTGLLMAVAASATAAPARQAARTEPMTALRSE